MKYLLVPTVVLAIVSTLRAEVLTSEQVVQQLMSETEKFSRDAAGFVLKRPHPAVAKLPVGTAASILPRLGDRLTGDAVRDTYIRYHLMHVLMQDDAPRDAKPYAALLASFPDSVPFERRKEGEYEPPELAAEYHKLVNQCRVTIGYPPFQKQIGPPESFEYMEEAQRKRCEKLWEQAQELRKKFTKTVDDGARDYNRRIVYVPWMARQVRGECLLAMVRSGETKAFQDAIAHVAKAGAADPSAAADGLQFLNAALADGWLAQYDAALLKSAAGTLKRAVIAADAALKPNQRQQHSLSEAAFTLITSLENGYIPSRPEPTEAKRPIEQIPKLARQQIKPEDITLEMIDNAIERALVAMDKHRPPETDLGPHSFDAAGVIRLSDGNVALSTWAMLAAGESPKSRWMQKRTTWVASFDSRSVYDRAMRLGVLASLPEARWMPWIKRDADWLINAITPNGGFTATVDAASKKTVPADNANSQYGLLGLASARKAGYEINEKVWRIVDKYWRDGQFPASDPNAGAWAVLPFSEVRTAKNSNAFEARPTGPMTAGGVLSLSFTERYLNGPKQIGVNTKLTPELAAGLNWLDANFDIDKVDGDSDLYYYLWTIQNVGQATGYRVLNKQDWFRVVTARLLSTQQSNGFWKGPKGEIVSTSYALLYLYRARGPLAFCKVRFDPQGKSNKPDAALPMPWNNRPHDLLNLTDAITEQTEIPTSWQIADLDQSVHELLESTALYLTTDRPFQLTEQQVDRLREYINAGGLLVMAPEGANTATAIASMRSLGASLYPKHEFKRIDRDHPYYRLAGAVKDQIPVSIVDNGVRPLMVIVERDISRDLQVNHSARRDAFALMTNIYLHATGLDTRRPRIATHYVRPAASPTRKALRAARIEHAGNFNPEPASLPQLAAIASHAGIGLTHEVIAPTALTAEVHVAFLTLDKGTKLTDADAKAIADWVAAGGTLWIDAAGGEADAVLAIDQTILKLGYRIDALKSASDSPAMGTDAQRPGSKRVESLTMRRDYAGPPLQLRTIHVADRPAIYVVHGDIGAGLSGVRHCGIVGFSVETTRTLVLNSLLALPAKPARKTK